MSDFISNTAPQRDKPLRVMGLWEEKDQNGNMMLSGNITGRARATITVNNFKKGDRDPDYYLSVVQTERQDQQGEEPQQEPQVRASIRLTGLWRNRDRKGKDYLSGSFQSLRILIFSNNYHQSDRDPDYILYVCQSDRQPNQQGGFGSQGGNFGFRGGNQNEGQGSQTSGSSDINEYGEPPF